ncbi:YdcF family protein [Streptomyces sp. SP17BM10]|uniref:YdcF family protein n=1 Tax=Streptomyces sp. SP17BM10 TaxID=3002530 RepID=UPI002E79A026|nr:YdcF family protein [Streptomyces sp. SP17BM10]MEE1783740.1 YdcF family protein [Streptomyces sp. SP17BM10]
MFAYAPAVLFFALCGIGVLRDRRRFSNAVLLGIAVSFLSLALLAELRHAPTLVAELAAVAIVALPALGTVALVWFLLANGVTMIRKEGVRPANLLSLLAGLGILAVLGLLVLAVATGSHRLGILAVTSVLVVGYVSFLFVCFVGYAFLYGRHRPRRDVDFVVVLGSGLIGGERVPPLLASRLNRGREVYEEQAARGNPPVLITSGGQGPDEKLPESHAMADYLVERGFPAEHVAREDRSRTTEENLLFSKAIMEGANPDYRCVVVTNNFHAFRAALTARRTGVNGQVFGSPTAAYYWPSATIREFAAVFLSHKLVNFGICGFLAVCGILAAL